MSAVVDPITLGHDKGKGPRISAGARLDRLPVGSFHRKMLFFIGVGLFLDSVDLSLGAGVLGALLRSGWSTMEMNASFVSATFLGMLVGAISSGVLSDRYGRRFAFQINLLIFGLASIAAAVAPDMVWLILCRFVMGVGMGAEVVVGYSTMSEMMPTKSRGRWVALSFIITNSGVLAASLLGLWLIPTIGWRYTFGLVGLLACVLWYMRKSMPESPRWLESKGRYEEADAALDRLEADYDRLPEPLPGGAMQTVAGPQSISVLFSAGVLRRTLLSILFYITQGLTMYGLVAWLPSFLVQQGHSIVSSLQFTTLMSFGAPFGGLVAFLLADRVGRRPFIIAGSLISAGLGVAYAQADSPLAISVVGFLLVTSLYFWVAAGLTLIPEMFATEYRFRGVGFCSMIGRLWTAVVQFVVVALFGWGGVHGVIGPIVALLVFQALMFLLFAKETSRRSLEELHQ